MIDEQTAITGIACCAGLVALSYLVYPIALHAAVRGRATLSSPPLPTSALPLVTIVIAAHNEETNIRERIENLLQLDYPSKKLEFLIASDGSTDATDSIVTNFDDERLRLLSHQPNRGKSYTLNRALPEASGEVIIMSDANTTFRPDAVAKLVRRLLFEDKPIAVCGKLILVDPITGNNLDGQYWKYESWQKKNEGLLAATLGANGGIYAFHKRNYVPIPDNTIIDDMTIPLLMKMEHGGNIVYEESAIASEEAAPTIEDEFGRRVRIGIGGYQSLSLLWPLLKPRYGFTAIAFFCHKLLRWFTPHFCVAGALFMALGMRSDKIQLFALGCAGIILLAYFARSSNSKHPVLSVLRLTWMFVSMNSALGLGFLRWLSEKQSGTWKRTAR